MYLCPFRRCVKPLLAGISKQMPNVVANAEHKHSAVATKKKGVHWNRGPYGEPTLNCSGHARCVYAMCVRALRQLIGRQIRGRGRARTDAIRCVPSPARLSKPGPCRSCRVAAVQTSEAVDQKLHQNKAKALSVPGSVSDSHAPSARRAPESSGSMIHQSPCVGAGRWHSAGQTRQLPPTRRETATPDFANNTRTVPAP